jgi:hypothetical protein
MAGPRNKAGEEAQQTATPAMFDEAIEGRKG